MKQLFIRNGKVVIENLLPPPLDAKSVLVKTQAVAISIGTEMKSLKGSIKSLTVSEYFHLVKQRLNNGTLWNAFQKKFFMTAPTAPPRTSYGVPTGYSCAGYIMQVGEWIKDVQPGDRVACAGSPHAEIVSVAENLFVPIPNNVSDLEAAFVALGSISLHAVRQADIKLGETIVVMGLGVIGQLVEQICRASGARTIGIDYVLERVKLCKKNGSHLAFSPNHEDVLSKVLDFTGGVGADAVLLCMGSESTEPINQALSMLRSRGKIVVVGTPRMDIPRSLFFQKEAELRIARSYGPGRYDPLYEQGGNDYPIDYVRWTERRNMAEFLRLISEGRVNVKSLITHQFDFEQAQLAYETALKGTGNVIGMALTFPKSKKILVKSKKVAKTSHKNIGVAVVGAGNFIRTYHLPNIKRIPFLKLQTIVTHHMRSARKSAIEFASRKATTNFKNAIQDASVDLVVIGTPHNLHASQTIAALENGKAVFCEKPMGMNRKEVAKVVETVKKTGGFYAIGFNRRFSPTVIRAKELLENRKTPLVMNYRVMGSFLSADHWVYDSVKGGGRVIGEACHFFDLLSYLAESEPLNLTAIGGALTHPGKRLDDNLICTVTFKDGSIASLVYGDLGMPQISKEILEIFSGDGVLVIDDFHELKTQGFSGQKGMTLPRIDKGHAELLYRVGSSLAQGLPSPVNEKDGLNAMECCFAVIDALQTKANNIRR